MGNIPDNKRRESLERLRNSYEQAKFSGDTKLAKMLWEIIKKVLSEQNLKK